MIDYNFVPETLSWCRQHYVPPIKEHIKCQEFGHTDPMDGSCHWCHDMYPYEWEMCQDESWVRGLLSPIARRPYKTREEAAEFIEEYKQRANIPGMTPCVQED